MTPLAFLQGVYYLLTGVWPLVSIGSFQRVTGPKTDLWLVRTVGVLVAVIGATLVVSAARRAPRRPPGDVAGEPPPMPPEVPVLATASAAGLGAIDTVYAARGRIARIYLLDAVLEAGLVAAWLLATRAERRVS